ncbi:hypothetical protein HGA64_03310 [Candidatus Falkowbacteria bacterium]|nr:hypothetical protein [Candidatus Falkowbacteria bacterium]
MPKEEKKVSTFEETFKRLETADPYLLVERLYSMFSAANTMSIAELIAAKQTINSVLQLNSFDECSMKMLAEITAALKSRIKVVWEECETYQQEILTDLYFARIDMGAHKQAKRRRWWPF